MKTRDLILSLSKDEAKISCFFSIVRLSENRFTLFRRLNSLVAA